MDPQAPVGDDSDSVLDPSPEPLPAEPQPGSDPESVTSDRRSTWEPL
jgi:hypothetical protein